MPTNLGEFNAAVREWAAKVPAEAVGIAQRKLALYALQQIVLKTPVDTGRARGNWQVSLGTLKVEQLTVTDPGGDDAIANGSAVIDQVPPFDVIFIANNLPYIEVLEEGGFEPKDPGPTKDKRRWVGGRPRVLVQGGFSIQAPNGMVRITFEELKAFFAEAA